MKELEKEICYLSNLVYKYCYEVAKKELDGEGEDTNEFAYDYAHEILSSSAITLGEILNGKLLIYALDCSPILAVKKSTGQMELWEYLSSNIKKKFDLILAIGLINEKSKLSSYDNSNFIYNFTKPYLENNYNMIKDEVMSWEEAFDLKEE